MNSGTFNFIYRQVYFLWYVLCKVESHWYCPLFTFQILNTSLWFNNSFSKHGDAQLIITHALKWTHGFPKIMDHLKPLIHSPSNLRFGQKFRPAKRKFPYSLPDSTLNSHLKIRDCFINSLWVKFIKFWSVK